MAARTTSGDGYVAGPGPVGGGPGRCGLFDHPGGPGRCTPVPPRTDPDHDHHHAHHHPALGRPDHRAHPGRPVVGWSAPATTLPPAGGFTSSSCISDVFCLAAGGGANQADASDSTGPGVVSSWDGATWMPAAAYFAGPGRRTDDGPRARRPSPAPADRAVRRGRRIGPHHPGRRHHLVAPVPLPPPPATAAAPADPGPDHDGLPVGCRRLPVEPVLRLRRQHRTRGHPARHDLVGTPQALTARAGSATVELFQSGRVGDRPAPRTVACTALVGGTALDWNGTSLDRRHRPRGRPPPPATRRCRARHRDVRGRPAGRLCRSGLRGRRGRRPGSIDANGRPRRRVVPHHRLLHGRRRLRQRRAPGRRTVVVAVQGGADPGRATRATAPACSCPTDQFCMVLTGDGDYATYQGADPTAAVATASTPGA